MLKSMKIPRKLGLSFLTICATAAIVMLVFYTSISSIADVDRPEQSQSQSIHAKALTLETALLRQNSQLRGFLVTADTSISNPITKAATNTTIPRPSSRSS
jgi:methyl-accepting chemotaxis protein